MKKEPPRLVLEIDPEKRARLKKVAALRDTTMKDMVEDCIDRILAENPLPEVKKAEGGH